MQPPNIFQVMRNQMNQANQAKLISPQSWKPSNSNASLNVAASLNKQGATAIGRGENASGVADPKSAKKGGARSSFQQHPQNASADKAGKTITEESPPTCVAAIQKAPTGKIEKTAKSNTRAVSGGKTAQSNTRAVSGGKTARSNTRAVPGGKTSKSSTDKTIEKSTRKSTEKPNGKTITKPPAKTIETSVKISSEDATKSGKSRSFQDGSRRSGFEKGFERDLDSSINSARLGSRNVNNTDGEAEDQQTVREGIEERGVSEMDLEEQKLAEGFDLRRSSIMSLKSLRIRGGNESNESTASATSKQASTLGLSGRETAAETAETERTRRETSEEWMKRNVGENELNRREIEEERRRTEKQVKIQQAIERQHQEWLADQTLQQATMDDHEGGELSGDIEPNNEQMLHQFASNLFIAAASTAGSMSSKSSQDDSDQLSSRRESESNAHAPHILEELIDGDDLLTTRGESSKQARQTLKELGDSHDQGSRSTAASTANLSRTGKAKAPAINNFRTEKAVKVRKTAKSRSILDKEGSSSDGSYEEATPQRSADNAQEPDYSATGYCTSRTRPFRFIAAQNLLGEESQNNRAMLLRGGELSEHNSTNADDGSRNNEATRRTATNSIDTSINDNSFEQHAPQVAQSVETNTIVVQQQASIETSQVEVPNHVEKYFQQQIASLEGQRTELTENLETIETKLTEVRKVHNNVRESYLTNHRDDVTPTIKSKQAAVENVVRWGQLAASPGHPQATLTSPSIHNIQNLVVTAPSSTVSPSFTAPRNTPALESSWNEDSLFVSPSPGGFDFDVDPPPYQNAPRTPIRRTTTIGKFMAPSPNTREIFKSPGGPTEAAKLGARRVEKNQRVRKRTPRVETQGCGASANRYDLDKSDSDDSSGSVGPKKKRARQLSPQTLVRSFKSNKSAPAPESERSDSSQNPSDATILRALRNSDCVEIRPVINAMIPRKRSRGTMGASTSPEKPLKPLPRLPDDGSDDGEEIFLYSPPKNVSAYTKRVKTRGIARPLQPAKTNDPRDSNVLKPVVKSAANSSAALKSELWSNKALPNPLTSPKAPSSVRSPSVSKAPNSPPPKTSMNTSLQYPQSPPVSHTKDHR